MENEAQEKMLQLLDLISVEVAANRNETSELCGEMRSGFGSVENVETRLGGVELQLRDFRDEFECRSEPLER